MELGGLKGFQLQSVISISGVRRWQTPITGAGRAAWSIEVGGGAAGWLLVRAGPGATPPTHGEAEKQGARSWAV